MIFLFHKWIYVKFLKLYWHIVFNKYRRNSFFNRYIECLLCGRHCSEKVESIIFFSVTNMSVSLTAHFPALGIIIFLNLASLMMKMIQFIFINNKSKTFLLCDDSWTRYNPFFISSAFLSGEFHEQRSLAGYSLWGHEESDTTESVHTLFASATISYILLVWIHQLFHSLTSSSISDCLGGLLLLHS